MAGLVMVTMLLNFGQNRFSFSTYLHCSLLTLLYTLTVLRCLSEQEITLIFFVFGFYRTSAQQC